MVDERINVVKIWHKPKCICDIQIFLEFANFYRCFIQSFRRIAALLTSMLWMSLISITQKSMNLVYEFGGGDHGENEAKKALASTKRPTGTDYLSSNNVSYAVNNSVSNSAKNVSNYSTPDAKRSSDQLRQTFTKVPIIENFNLGRYIQVETDASGHAIGGVLSQLTNDLGQWHPVSYNLWKMILAKT